MNNQKITNSSNSAFQHHQYGLLSIIALIVGCVIGSGVYFVNNSLYIDSGESIGLALISWFLISMIILFILISFIEISSITAKTNEPGTINNWVRHLWNKKYSKYIGVFFALIYFSILLPFFALIFAGSLLSSFNFTYFSMPGEEHTWIYFISSFAIAVFAILLVYLMNIFTMRPGKIFQGIGTFIKLIPLFTIVLIGFFAIVGAITTDVDPNPIFNFEHPGKHDKSSFMIILLLTPTIMFSYDGFLFAASLQNEAKKPSSYKIAAFTGVIFIILIYLLSSIFSFLYGNAGENSNFSVTASVSNIFPNADWIVPLFSSFILISVLTTLSGNSISNNRMIADLSANNEIRDPKGNLIARNRALVPQNSAILSLCLTLAFLCFFRALDAVATFSYLADDHVSSSYDFLAIHGWTINLITIFAYSFYVFIIVGAIRNRFNKKVEVDKIRGFSFFAIVSVIAITIILAIFTFDTFRPGDFRIYDVRSGNSYWSWYAFTTYLIQIFVFVLMTGIIFFIPWYLDKDLRKMTKEDRKRKQLLIDNYQNKIVSDRYLR